MRTVHEMLQHKGTRVHSILPDASVQEALMRMAEHNIGALVVIDAGRPIGIFSERDYARRAIAKSGVARSEPVRGMMTRDVRCVYPTASVQDCMQIMTDARVRHLPVTEGDRLVGMISIGDVVKELIDEKQYLIEQLEHYITGSF